MVGANHSMTSPRSAALSLCWERFSFTYPDTTAPVLREVDLKIEPGEQVLLMGSSGCGKSYTRPYPERDRSQNHWRLGLRFGSSVWGPETLGVFRFRPWRL